jgi:23S rRNA (pseudouridine1915-N3)-methyltransferase
VRITLIAVGRLKEPYWRDAAAEYLKRLRPYATIDIVEVPDRDVTADERGALKTEAEGILRAVPDGAHVVVLEIGGKQLTSEGFSAWLELAGVQGRSTVAFILGGAAGLDASVLARANERLSLGAMTLPHQLARVVLLEQVYRGFRIMRGEPYHR